MSDLDEKLHEILYDLADSFYFEGSYPEWFEEKVYPELAEKIKGIFKDRVLELIGDNEVLECDCGSSGCADYWGPFKANWVRDELRQKVNEL